MLTIPSASCLPRTIAIYIMAYPLISRLQWLANWWTGTVEVGHPIPSSITTFAVQVVNIVFVLWLLVAGFVWLRWMWARWFVACTALVLGVAQCFLYTDMLRSYGSAGLVSEMLLGALPPLFLAAILFCPAVGQSFRRHERI